MTNQNGSYSVNLGYPQWQLAKAFFSYHNATDNAVTQNAINKIEKWQQVLQQLLDGQVQYGSRTPFQGVPPWVTLEVATGGFATGVYKAGGLLQEHEKMLLATLALNIEKDQERLVLNSYFLTQTGLDQLISWLNNATYDINVPEEAALLTVAYLLLNDQPDEARKLVEEISPWFAHLRFYPVPLAQPKLSSVEIRMQDVEDSLKSLSYIKRNRLIAAQKEAIQVWALFKHEMVELFLQTVKQGIPCQRIDANWREKVAELLREFESLRQQHIFCHKVNKKKSHFYQLKCFLQRCLISHNLFQPTELKQITFILEQHIRKHGQPNSVRHQEYQQKQLTTVAAASFYDISNTLIYRFKDFPKEQGFNEITFITQPITLEESRVSQVPQGTKIPNSLQHKMLRSLNTDLETLIKHDLVTSGEVIARLLPQFISRICATSIAEPRLRGLYTQVYKAFLARRSLLLLNLEKQIQLEELPWVKAIENYRQAALSNKALAKEALAEICALTLASFPQTILPNKLLQEFQALAKTAGLNLPLTEELAADIFMGDFSNKFVEAVEQASYITDQSLYANYYQINSHEITLALGTNKPSPKYSLFIRHNKREKQRSNNLLAICEKRAGLKFIHYNVAENGMLLEQAQILSTHNLAILLNELDLHSVLKDRLFNMVMHCFISLCKRLQTPFRGFHASLISIKQSAYAWRQMIFFLSLMPPEERKKFLDWATSHLHKQKPLFQTYFKPVLVGLIQVNENCSHSITTTTTKPPHIFLAWSSQHWLLDMMKAQ